MRQVSAVPPSPKAAGAFDHNMQLLTYLGQVSDSAAATGSYSKVPKKVIGEKRMIKMSAYQLLGGCRDPVAYQASCNLGSKVVPLCLTALGRTLSSSVTKPPEDMQHLCLASFQGFSDSRHHEFTGLSTVCQRNRRFPTWQSCRHPPSGLEQFHVALSQEQCAKSKPFAATMANGHFPISSQPSTISSSLIFFARLLNFLSALSCISRSSSCHNGIGR